MIDSNAALNQDYNGWENRWTWLVHLHLSNDEQVAQDIRRLVTGEPNRWPAGHLVEMWVKLAIEHWLTAFPGRERAYDAMLGLLVWDVVGSALAHAEWDRLVWLLVEQVIAPRNRFTSTLFRHLVSTPALFDAVCPVLIRSVPVGVMADQLKAWFEEQLAVWIELAPSGRHVNTLVSPVFHELVMNVYGFVVWYHVAQAFRPGR